MTASPLGSRPWVGPAVFAYGSLAAAVFVFLAYRRQGLVDGIVDLNGFGAIAKNLVEGHGFSSGYGPTIRRGPLYPFFGALLLTLFGSDDPSLPEAIYYRPILIGNCVLFGLTCLVVWSTARRLFDPRVGLLAALICPFVPQSLRYLGMTEVETSMGLFTALLAATGISFVKTPNARTGAAFGLAAAAATLTKPIVLLYPFGFLALAFLYWRKIGLLGRERLVGASAVLVCFGALLIPWSIRNIIVTDGQFKGISSNAPAEFLRGYINAQPKYYLLRQDFGGGDPNTEKWDPEANAYEERLLGAHGVPFYRSLRDAQGKPYLVPAPKPGVTGAMLELERDRIESAEVKRKLIQEPGAFVSKFFVQLFTFWYIVETRTKSLFVGGVAFVMLSLSVIGYRRASRRGALVWPVAAVILYFNAIYAAFLAFARYSMPLFPTLVVLAAGGIATIGDVLLRKFRPNAEAASKEPEPNASERRAAIGAR